MRVLEVSKETEAEAKEQSELSYRLALQVVSPNTGEATGQDSTPKEENGTADSDSFYSNYQVTSKNT